LFAGEGSEVEEIELQTLSWLHFDAANLLEIE